MRLRPALVDRNWRVRHGHREREKENLGFTNVYVCVCSFTGRSPKERVTHFSRNIRNFDLACVGPATNSKHICFVRDVGSMCWWGRLSIFSFPISPHAPHPQQPHSRKLYRERNILISWLRYASSSSHPPTPVVCCWKPSRHPQLQ